MNPSPCSPAPSFLIVCLRLIGDVLLSTSLALSIKKHRPEATVDYAVYDGTQGVLARNRDVRQVHTVRNGISGVRTFARLWRRYDYAIGVNASDRTAFLTAGSAHCSIGFVTRSRKDWWKPYLLTYARHYDRGLHTVPAMLSQLEPLEIPPIPRVIAAFDAEDRAFADQRLGPDDFVLLHPYTRRPYKCWPPAAWAKLAVLIRTETGLRAVFSRGAGAADEAQLDEIRRAVGGALDCFAESFTFAQLAAAIHKSRGFVGVDTAVTHMAAALATPVVALYGPSSALRWGPWPNGCSIPRPYGPSGGVQRQVGITVLQPDWPCVPCDRETCAISKRGRIECMETLDPAVVLQELQRLVASGRPRVEPPNACLVAAHGQ